MLTFDGSFSDNDRETTFRALGRGITFLQIGAMDGVRFDPIHDCVVNLGWKGLLVEPIPDIFELLKKNYAGMDSLVFENCAITDYEGEIDMERVDPAAVERGELPPEVLGVTTMMNERHLLDTGYYCPPDVEKVKKYTRKISVPCMRLSKLLEKHPMKHIDLLSIDTEGADWIVTRQFPLEQFTPRIVYIEWKHLTPYEQRAAWNHFKNHGYRLFIQGRNSENIMAVNNSAA